MDIIDVVFEGVEDDECSRLNAAITSVKLNVKPMGENPLFKVTTKEGFEIEFAGKFFKEDAKRLKGRIRIMPQFCELLIDELHISQELTSISFRLSLDSESKQKFHLKFDLDAFSDPLPFLLVDRRTAKKCEGKWTWFPHQKPSFPIGKRKAEAIQAIEAPINHTSLPNEFREIIEFSAKCNGMQHDEVGALIVRWISMVSARYGKGPHHVMTTQLLPIVDQEWFCGWVVEGVAQRQLKDRESWNMKPILRAGWSEPDINPFAVETGLGKKASIPWHVDDGVIGFINSQREQHQDLKSLFSANPSAKDKRDKFLKRSEWRMYQEQFVV
eukprot:TRINITY_DN10051_c0_g1_i1.p1 TRINITY_DN10051_c0_g1~~TRINITY_DN10051_c0_g1_i1.p1  ORF type:complete len:328 (-),score=58.24 TRINITY_DN10051_c0_g1_i1:140-1123(-)